MSQTPTPATKGESANVYVRGMPAPNDPAPADVAAIHRAFTMAASLPVGGGAVVRVGVLAADGVLLVSQALRGDEQVALLADQLRPLHFVAYHSARALKMFGCDVLLRHKPPTGLADDLVRKGDAQSW